MEINKSQIAVLKLIAITSVVIAHINIETPELLYLYLKDIYQFLGSIGVGIFFFLQGYNLNSNKTSYDTTKANLTIILPWITSSLFVFLYIAIRKPTDPTDFLRFFFGDGSYLYFLTIFFIFSALSFLLKNHYLRLILMAFSIIYYIYNSKIMPFNISEHLNPLLWLPYLIVGYSIKSRDKKITNTIIIFSPIFISIIIFLGALSYSNNHNSFNYLNINLVTSVIIIVAILKLITSRIKVGYIVGTISRNTLFIYLWHMPLIGIINFFSNKFTPPLHFLSFVILLSIFLILIESINKNFPSNKVAKIIGIKNKTTEC